MATIDPTAVANNGGVRNDRSLRGSRTSGATVELANRCCAGHLASQARAGLVELVARPRRAASTGVDALTGSERRVAELAAAGHSKREIAQALFITVRTVEVHLTAAYRKLGIATRKQLSTALAAAADHEGRPRGGGARRRQAAVVRAGMAGPDMARLITWSVAAGAGRWAGAGCPVRRP